MNYILVVDDEADIRDIYEMVLKRAFPLDVIVAPSGNKAIETIMKRGKPEIIISDLRMVDGDGHFLHRTLIENNWKIPLVICSTDSVASLKKKFPDIHGYIEKPNIIGPVVELVDSVVGRHKTPPMYVPIRISLLLRLGTANFDLYMKLSEKKFIRVINAGEAFIPDDAERFFAKGFEHLFITAEDADQYLKNLEKSISIVMTSESSSQNDLAEASLESLESVERLAASLGWTPEVLEAAKHAVNLAVKAVSSEPDLLKLFRLKLRNPTSRYSGHISMLALLTCGFCFKLGWQSDSTLMKLGLASLMHDLSIDEDIYHDVTLWNQAASDSNDKAPLIVKYRNHPIDSAALLQTMKNVPADVDQIILQHHEMKDGSGFPRGLIGSRITPMACIFIIVEDLINFFEESEDFDEKIKLFLKYRESRYTSGNFKKVFDAFKDSVEKSKSES